MEIIKRVDNRVKAMTLVRFLLGVLIPPVGVFLTYGVSTTLLINIVLTLLGWVPGSIHAVWAIAKHEERMAQVR
jgi:uncharacterized membrane protein YqaE (UPF0057 family)